MEVAGRERRTTLAVFAVLAASVAFGTTGTAQAKGPSGTTPLSVGAVRIAIGAAALVTFAAVRRLRHGPGLSCPGLLWWPQRAHWPIVAVGGIGVALYQPMFFAGTERSGVAIGTIVALGSGPAFVGAWEAVALRRRPSETWLLATALALGGGALLVATQSGESTSRLDAVGVLCSLAAGLGYATYALAAKALVAPPAGRSPVDSSIVMAWIFAVGALLLSPALATEPLGWLATRSGVMMSLHLGIVTVAIAYVLYGYGLRTLATSTAATLTLAEPVTAAIAGVVVLDERLRAAGWFGAVLVAAGLALTGLWRPRVRSAPAAALGGGGDGAGQTDE